MRVLDSSMRKERGQSLIEFTFMLFVLLVLVTGIVDASRAFFTYLAMRDAAQEGALYGSTNPCDNASICNRVQHTSNLIEGIWSNLTVSRTINDKACLGGAIQVTVAYDNFIITMPFIGAFHGRQSVPISATVTDTILTPSCQVQTTCP